MNKPILHISIDSDYATEEVLARIEETLGQELKEEYNVIITTSSMALEIYDKEQMDRMERNLDSILDELEKMRSAGISAANIKHIYGIQ